MRYGAKLSNNSHTWMLAGVLLVSFCIFFAGIGRQLRTHLCTASLSYTIDTLFSDAMVAELCQMVTTELRSNGPAQALQALQNKHPYITDATCAYRPSNRAHIVITGKHPHSIINDNKVVFDDGLLVPTSIFQSDVLNSLNRITVEQLEEDSHTLSNEISKVLLKIPTSLYSIYDVTWHSNHALIINEKNKNDVFFVFDTQDVPDEVTLAACQKIAQECRVAPSRKHRFVVDARFENQIIVYGDTGGYGHGSCIG